MDAERALALELACDVHPSPSNIRRVAMATTNEAAAWAFTQWQLRRAGQRKFSFANEMLFVREALEQATGEVLAAYHASKFAVAIGSTVRLPSSAPTQVRQVREDEMDRTRCRPDGIASQPEIADLTCGIGGDLIAFARVAPTVGYELDPERADCARHNLAVHGVKAEVRVENCLDHLGEFTYAFADPARRVQGRRTTELAEFQPDVTRIAAAMRGMELGGMKLSPLLPDSTLASFGGRVEFVSFGGECREALVWLGKGSGEAGTFAVWTNGERVEAVASSEPPIRVEEAKTIIAEADPAAIRAHALGSLGGHALGDSNGYLTAETDFASVWLRRYRVLFDSPWRPKALQAELRRLDAKVTAVKSRAKAVTVEEATRSLKDAGSKPVVLIVYPVGPKVRAAIAVPVQDA